MINRLMLFGLTRQEATIYICLCQNGARNGYEVAKQTGISRSNVYNALAGLVEKGAANRMEASSNKYWAVGLEELCENRMRALSEAKQYLMEHIKPFGEGTSGYITIDGFSHIKDKIISMLSQTEHRVYLSMAGEYVMEFASELSRLLAKEKKVVLLTDEAFEMEGATIYRTNPVKNQIHLIVDSCYVLTGEYTKSPSDNCLYSEQKNFVSVLKQALRNEIKLFELGERNT